jgi:hypothetical protein
MTDVLTMSAGKLSHPVAFIILVVTHDCAGIGQAPPGCNCWAQKLIMLRAHNDHLGSLLGLDERVLGELRSARPTAQIVQITDKL